MATLLPLGGAIVCCVLSASLGGESPQPRRCGFATGSLASGAREGGGEPWHCWRGGVAWRRVSAVRLGSLGKADSARVWREVLHRFRHVRRCCTCGLVANNFPHKTASTIQSNTSYHLGASCARVTVLVIASGVKLSVTVEPRGAAHATHIGLWRYKKCNANHVIMVWRHGVRVSAEDTSMGHRAAMCVCCTIRVALTAPHMMRSGSAASFAHDAHSQNGSSTPRIVSEREIVYVCMCGFVSVCVLCVGVCASSLDWCVCVCV